MWPAIFGALVGGTASFIGTWFVQKAAFRESSLASLERTVRIALESGFELLAFGPTTPYQITPAMRLTTALKILQQQSRLIDPGYSKRVGVVGERLVGAMKNRRTFDQPSNQDEQTTVTEYVAALNSVLSLCLDWWERPFYRPRRAREKALRRWRKKIPWLD